MSYEVVVVGGGVAAHRAASLAARGVNVCLLERQSDVGGLRGHHRAWRSQVRTNAWPLRGWEAGGIYERLCSALGTTPPRAHPQSTAYVVRLPDGIEIPRTTQIEDFEAHLGSAFQNARRQRSTSIAASRISQTRTESKTFAAASVAMLAKVSSLRRRTATNARSVFSRRVRFPVSGERVRSATPVLEHRRWRAALIDTLAQSFKQSGGALRLNSTALRLAYGSNGVPIGVDLLNGEQVIATRAIVSNLTIWDTYGKLIGPARTPRDISSRLRDLRAWGAYQMFLTLNNSIAASVPSTPGSGVNRLARKSALRSERRSLYSPLSLAHRMMDGTIVCHRVRVYER